MIRQTHQTDFRRRVLVRLGVVGLTLACAGAGRASDGPRDVGRYGEEPAELRTLVDRIAAGDEQQATEAAEQLAERIVGPLVEALANAAQRPPEQQERLFEALGRLTAVLRLRLHRAELPPEDQRLFDEFVRAHRDLAERLFHDDARRRLAALAEIPLEPGTGAGLMLVAKLHDWDVSVLEAALEATARLKDEVVARGLVRFVRKTTDLVCSGRLDPVEQDVAIAYTDLTRLAVHQLGKLQARDSAPAILAAIECFDRPGLRRLFQPAQALAALGHIGDERAVPTLLRYVERREVYALRAVAPGTLVKQTVGDTALLALLRIYGLSPDELGFYMGQGPNPITGFVDDQVRAAALETFLNWYRENHVPTFPAPLPRGQAFPRFRLPAYETSAATVGTADETLVATLRAALMGGEVRQS